MAYNLDSKKAKKVHKQNENNCYKKRNEAQNCNLSVWNQNHKLNAKFKNIFHLPRLGADVSVKLLKVRRKRVCDSQFDIKEESNSSF